MLWPKSCNKLWLDPPNTHQPTNQPTTLPAPTGTACLPAATSEADWLKPNPDTSKPAQPSPNPRTVGAKHTLEAAEDRNQKKRKREEPNTLRVWRRRVGPQNTPQKNSRADRIRSRTIQKSAPSSSASCSLFLHLSTHSCCYLQLGVLVCLCPRLHTHTTHTAHTTTHINEHLHALGC